MSSRLDQLLSFRKNNPNDSFILFALAKEYEKMEQVDQALKHYIALTDFDAQYVGTYYHLGKIYEQLDQPEKAFETYTEGMQVARQQGDKHALSELAGARLNLGDEEDFIME